MDGCKLLRTYAFNLTFGGQELDLNLNSDSQTIWQDFSLGGGLSAVGDLNHDGYDEIAFSRAIEGGRVG